MSQAPDAESAKFRKIRVRVRINTSRLIDALLTCRNPLLLYFGDWYFFCKNPR